MTLGEFRKATSGFPDDMPVYVCIETPGGFVCPDGATVDVKTATEGMDWHDGQLLIVPKYRLRLRDDAEVEKWSRRQ